MDGAGRVLKIVTVGDGAVGKTSLLVAYTQGAFDSTYIPTVFENYAGCMDVNGKQYNFTLWDTAGQEGFDKIRVLCYDGANAFLVCFSVNSRTSFDNIHQVWVPEIRKQCGQRVPLILVGTKADLRDGKDKESYITKAEAKKLVKTLNMSGYVESSAKNMTGLDDVFQTAVKATEPPPRSKFRCIIQ